MTEFWVMRMLGYMPDESTMGPLLIYACQGTTIDAMLPASDQEIAERVNRLAALIGMSPQFNMR
jgi:hypothetical protein